MHCNQIGSQAIAGNQVNVEPANQINKSLQECNNELIIEILNSLVINPSAIVLEQLVGSIFQ